LPFFFFFVLGAGCGTAVVHNYLKTGLIAKTVLLALPMFLDAVKVLSCYAPSSHSKIASASSK